jgi:cation:H+ antiporter
MMLLSLAAATAMAFDIQLGEQRDEFTRSDGLIFLLFFVVFMYYTVGDLLRQRAEDRESPRALVDGAEDFGSPLRNGVISMVGLAALLAGARMTVMASVDLARALDIPEVVIGLTMVSIGTSLPELVAALAAVRRNQLDIAVGGIVGSNIFNTLLVAGVTSVVRPMEIPKGGHLDLGVTIVLSLILMLNARSHNRSIIRSEGMILLAVYLSYMFWRVMTIPAPGA